LVRKTWRGRAAYVLEGKNLNNDFPVVARLNGENPLSSEANLVTYCAAHPDSPSATRRPAVSIRSGLWIALLGPGLEEGIVGIGYTVESALRAFDTQYMAGQHSPSEPDESRAACERAHRLIRSAAR
jgi:hypothetical protein